MKPAIDAPGLQQFMDTRERFYDVAEVPPAPKDAPFAAASEHLRKLRQSDSESGESDSTSGDVDE